MSLSDKWVWITIFSVVLVIVLPLIVIWGILNMSPELAFIATLGILVIWAVVSGYKDWVISKRQES
jgi:predicted ABC-type exoprotein transport system permease subunit